MRPMRLTRGTQSLWEGGLGKGLVVRGERGKIGGKGGGEGLLCAGALGLHELDG